ncbi:MAG: tyrosine-type recombinase/integrase [Halomonas sp.]|nr:tyrosine-type recombinase/integrase [Halomonas sp.]
MAHAKKQGLETQSGHAPDASFRQCSSPDDPIDRQSRPINYLTESEVKRLVKGAKTSRNSERDALLITMLFRHGLRESEARMLRLNSMKLDSAQIWIERAKRGRSSFHPISGEELRMIRRYLRTRDDDLPWLFISERLQPLSDRTVRVIVKNAGEAGGLGHVHPHMLRHACGYYLHNLGHNSRLIQDYLGHSNPSSTMIYTRTAAKQFEGLF